MLLPESELEAMVVHHIHDIKHHYALWANPRELARELEISLTFGKLGPDQEGAAFAERIVLDPTRGVKARQRFTFYHEIVHHVIRRNDKLYSILHDQYCSDDDLTRIIEHLCNVGAAEFVIPRSTVRAAIEAEGFSIAQVRMLSKVDEVSPTAVCVQLVLCAKQRCIATVCKMVSLPRIDGPKLVGEMKPGMALQVAMAISSPCTKYAIRRGKLLPKGHLFYEAYEMAGDDIVRGTAPIPLRDTQKWRVPCEAMRRGKQLFGIFHIDPPPGKISGDQLRLF